MSKRLSPRGEAKQTSTETVYVETTVQETQEEAEQRFREEQIQAIDNKLQSLAESKASLKQSLSKAKNKGDDTRYDRYLNKIVSVDDQTRELKAIKSEIINQKKNITAASAIDYARGMADLYQEQDVLRAEKKVTEKQKAAALKYRQEQARKLEGRGFRQLPSGAIINVRTGAKIKVNGQYRPTVESINLKMNEIFSSFEDKKAKTVAKPSPQPPSSSTVLSIEKGNIFSRTKEKIVSSDFYRSLPINFEKTGDPIFKIDFNDPKNSQIYAGFRFATKKQLEREAIKRQAGRDIYFLETRTKKTEKIFKEFQATGIVPVGAEAYGIKVTTETKGDEIITTLSDPVLETRIKEVETRIKKQEADTELYQGFFANADKALSQTIFKGEKKQQSILSKSTAGQSLLLLQTFGTPQARKKFLLTSDFIINPLEKSLIKAQATGEVVSQLSEARKGIGVKKALKTTPISFIENPIGATGQYISMKYQDRPRTFTSAIGRGISSQALATREMVTLPRAYFQEFEQKPVTRGTMFAGAAAISGGLAFASSSSWGVTITQSATTQAIGTTGGILLTGAYAGYTLSNIARSPRGRMRTQLIAKTGADLTTIGAGAVVGAKLGMFSRAKFEEFQFKYMLRKKGLELKTLTSATEGGHPRAKSIKNIPREFKKSPYRLPKERMRLQSRRGFHATIAEPKYLGTRVIRTTQGVRTEKIFGIEASKSTLPTGEPRGFYISNQISTGRFGGGSSLASFARNPNIFGVGTKQVVFRVTGEKAFISPPYSSQAAKVQFIEQTVPRGQGVYPLQKTELEAVFGPSLQNRPALVAVKDTGYYSMFNSRPVNIKGANVLGEQASLRLGSEFMTSQRTGLPITNPIKGGEEIITFKPSGATSYPLQPSSSNLSLLSGFYRSPYATSYRRLSLPKSYSVSYASSISSISEIPSDKSSKISSDVSDISSDLRLSSKTPSYPSDISITPESTTSIIPSSQITPIPTPPPSSPFGIDIIGGGEFGFKSQFKRLKGPKGYVPSLVAIVGGITGSVDTGGLFSGFEIRPIPSKRKSSKRRKKR